jgi:zinc transport system ATP-binding protein
MSILSCNHVTLGYDGKEILTDVDFAVGRDSYLCVIGENGAGKSTLIKGLLGLIKPMKGKFVAGEGFKMNEIGYLPQQTDIQRDFPASVREVVLSGCGNRLGARPFFSSAEKELALEKLNAMGIYNLRKKSYQELSGGQQQRVLLARALCATRKLLLLDEPVSGLDPKVTLEMYQIIEKLNREDGVTVIMISHDVSAAVHYASHILHIGHNVFFGPKADYLQSDLARRFLALEGGKIQ